MMDSTAARECTLTERVSKRYIYFEIRVRLWWRALQKTWLEKCSEFKNMESQRAFERQRQQVFIQEPSRRSHSKPV